MTAALSQGPHVDPATGDVTFIVEDQPGVRPQRVWYHLRDFGDDPTFAGGPDGWVTHIPAPPVNRLEYLLVLKDAHGSERMILDPANPARVAGVFGDHSVLELPGYQAPEWLGSHDAPWDTQPFRTSTRLELTGSLCSPAGVSSDVELPLLVVHDGPEYASFARLLDYLAWAAAREPALRCRVLLLAPGERNREYAADPEYAQTLVTVALPQARELAATAKPVLGAGASLGALSLLHAAVRYPGTFAGLFCQSGSFFLPAFDSHERRFEFYYEVTELVARFDAEPARLSGLEVALTCGQGEENLDNNRAMAARLHGLGVPVTFTEGRDAHSYTAWRDLLQPALADLMRRVWRLPVTG
ncbi:MAG: alpha/beta hydrolase-fold protein [Candidatus Nanopelagicales bacterium]